MYDLEALGWGPFFSAALEQHQPEGLIPARVAVEHHGFYELLAEVGELGGVPSVRLKFDGDEPAVGDWVAVEKLPGERKAVIRAVLPRRTTFSRRNPGSGRPSRSWPQTWTSSSSSRVSRTTSTCAASSGT